MGTNLVWVPLMFLYSPSPYLSLSPPQTNMPALPLQAFLPSLPSLYSSPKPSLYLARSEDGTKGNGRLQCIKGIVRQKRSFPFQWEITEAARQQLFKASRKTSREKTVIFCFVRGRAGDFAPATSPQSAFPFLDVRTAAISRCVTAIWCEFDVSVQPSTTRHSQVCL